MNPILAILRSARSEPSKLCEDSLQRPDGIAFSPDERCLYVTNWDPSAKIVARYGVAGDGALRGREVPCGLGSAPEPEALDGDRTLAAGHQAS